MAILNKEGIDRITHKKDRLAEENLWGMLSKIRECKEGIIDFLDTKNELHRDFTTKWSAVQYFKIKNLYCTKASYILLLALLAKYI